jgi:hypothetical protein
MFEIMLTFFRLIGMLQVSKIDFLADSVFFPTGQSTHNSSTCLRNSCIEPPALIGSFFGLWEKMTRTQRSKIILFFMQR